MAKRLPAKQATAGRRWQESLLSLSLLAGLWWIISEGSTTGWLIGLPAVVLAGWARQRLEKISESHLSLAGQLRFAPYFLWESLRGGLDVAVRTLMPRMRIQPGFITYRSKLQGLSAQTFFTNCVSLLPGTLAADIRDEHLEIHVLNLSRDPHNDLSRLEHAVARLFVDEEITR